METDHQRRRASFELRVLVVDDEPFIGSAIRRVFRRDDVTCAGSASEALTLIEVEGPFDAVICDVQMPGTSGVELYQRVRESSSTQAGRFVFLTGAEAAREGLQEFGVPVLDKPFSNDELRRVVLDLARA